MSSMIYQRIIMFRFSLIFPAFSNAQLESDVCKLLRMLLPENIS